jgi:outer membrane autotransporter protein
MTLTGKLLIAAASLAAFTGSAMAADLYVPPPAAPVAPIVSTTNWDGPYIGASVGYGWQTLNSTPAVSGNGWLVGAQLGYNFHVSDPLVLGIEGNLDWQNGAGGTAPNSYSINWDGSIRARLGVDVDTILPYIEAGVAFANVTDNTVPVTEVRTGWTAGVGIEFMLADQLSTNVEYRYADYGTGSSGNRLTDNSIRVGLNYHF